MPDDLDLAAEHIEREAALRLHAASEAVKKRELTPRGTCYYCEARLPDDRIFCDSECGEDFEKERKARMRNAR